MSEKHVQRAKKYWDNLPDEKKKKILKKTHAGLKAYWAGKSSRTKKKIGRALTKARLEKNKI